MLYLTKWKHDTKSARISGSEIQTVKKKVLAIKSTDAIYIQQKSGSPFLYTSHNDISLCIQIFICFCFGLYVYCRFYGTFWFVFGRVYYIIVGDVWKRRGRLCVHVVCIHVVANKINNHSVEVLDIYIATEAPLTGRLERTPKPIGLVRLRCNRIRVVVIVVKTQGICTNRNKTSMFKNYKVWQRSKVVINS
jgi:hypothetical protein